MQALANSPQQEHPMKITPNFCIFISFNSLDYFNWFTGLNDVSWLKLLDRLSDVS
jgi:hypothetical protein